MHAGSELSRVSRFQPKRKHEQATTPDCQPQRLRWAQQRVHSGQETAGTTVAVASETGGSGEPGAGGRAVHQRPCWAVPPAPLRLPFPPGYVDIENNRDAPRRPWAPRPHPLPRRVTALGPSQQVPRGEPAGLGGSRWISATGCKSTHLFQSPSSHGGMPKRHRAQAAGIRTVLAVPLNANPQPPALPALSCPPQLCRCPIISHQVWLSTPNSSLL